MFDAIVLAGGSAARLGGADKPGVRIGTATMLERVLAAVSGARRRVLVGPDPGGLPGDVLVCREEPVGAGPAAALAAGLVRTAADRVMVLAADLPAIAPAIPVLLAALAGTPDAGTPDVAALATAGRRNYLAAAWRRAALVDALTRLGDPVGAPVRRLYDGVRAVWPADPDGWGLDCDTWADVAAARERVEA